MAWLERTTGTFVGLQLALPPLVVVGDPT